MTQIHRFSPRPNRAHEIAWQEWGAAAFAEAESTNRPVLLSLTAVWCHWCHRMDETTYSDPAVIDLLNSDVIPIRVDGDRNPHVQDRYITGGWPTNAFLTPTGEVLWAGAYVDAESLLSVARSVITAWSDRRDEFALEIERRRRALDASRGRHSSVGLVRREASDDVVSATREAFDARNGGFGDAPKFPPGDTIALLYSLASNGDADALIMADRTLDGMLAGELQDSEAGGFFRYATSAEWTAPRYEKLLEINALQVEAYALGASVRARPDWAEIVERTVAWVDETLGQPGGLWGGSQAADEAYFTLNRSARKGQDAPAVDHTILTNANAAWIAALANAGGRLKREDWIARADAALHTLITDMSSANGLLYHYRAEDCDPALDFLLVDALETARATLALAQATGDSTWLAHTRRLVKTMETSFWAEDGGFWDRARTAHDVGALRYRDRPFDLNARCARLLLDLGLATGERGYRALAERTLALLSPQAGRYGVAGAAFAIAVEEFFSLPPYVVIVGAPSAAVRLRMSALALPHADRRVWSLPDGGRMGTQTIAAQPAPAAYAYGKHGCSAPVLDDAALVAAIAPLV
ncbi:MAG: DUF255 domain-containing protein [Longimicrobiales bacterium]